MAEGFVTEGIVELQRQYVPYVFCANQKAKRTKSAVPTTLSRGNELICSVRCVIYILFFFFFPPTYRPHFIISLPEKQLIKFEWPYYFYFLRLKWPLHIRSTCHEALNFTRKHYISI